jgi:DNA helicase-2/ATP-dependent DNA helicase PcrA
MTKFQRTVLEIVDKALQNKFLVGGVVVAANVAAALLGYAILRNGVRVSANGITLEILRMGHSSILLEVQPALEKKLGETIELDVEVSDGSLTPSKFTVQAQLVDESKMSQDTIELPVQVQIVEKLNRLLDGQVDIQTVPPNVQWIGDGLRALEPKKSSTQEESELQQGTENLSLEKLASDFAKLSHKEKRSLDGLRNQKLGSPRKTDTVQRVKEYVDGENQKYVDVLPQKQEAQAWSQEQETIFKFVASGHGHGMIKAVAGSGKTTTLCEVMRRTSATILYLAFNKSISKEVETKVKDLGIGKRVVVKTIHKFGKDLLKEAAYKFEIAGVNKGKGQRQHLIMDQKKKMEIVRQIFEEQGNKTSDFNKRSAYVDKKKQNLIVKIASMAQATLSTSPDEIEALLDRVGENVASDLVPQERLVEFVQEVLKRAKEQTRVIDFDDMIWLPNVFDLRPRQQYTWVLVDEAQDLNMAQIQLVRRAAAASGTRVLFVGDPYQSIYGFRGAEFNSMEKMVEALGGTEHVRVLSLNVSYRCPKSHVELARRIVPEICALESAATGKIVQISLAQAYELFKPQDLVICRRNRPIVEIAFNLLKQNRAAMLVGEESLQKQMKEEISLHENKEDFKKALNEEKDKLIALAKKRRLWEKIQRVQDFYECLEFLYNQMHDLQELRKRIDEIFVARKSKLQDIIRCSSVHRAKGTEASRVFIISPQLFFTKLANSTTDDIDQSLLREEQNLVYVAITRSREELFLVGGSIPDMAWKHY